MFGLGSMLGGAMGGGLGGGQPIGIMASLGARAPSKSPPSVVPEIGALRPLSGPLSAPAGRVLLLGRAVRPLERHPATASGAQGCRLQRRQLHCFEPPGGPEHTFLLLDAPMGLNLGNLDLHNPHGRMATRPALQGPSSSPAPYQGAPGGSGRLDTPRRRGRPNGRPATAQGAQGSHAPQPPDPAAFGHPGTAPSPAARGAPSRAQPRAAAAAAPAPALRRRCRCVRSPRASVSMGGRCPAAQAGVLRYGVARPGQRAAASACRRCSAPAEPPRRPSPSDLPADLRADLRCDLKDLKARAAAAAVSARAPRRRRQRRCRRRCPRPLTRGAASCRRSAALRACCLGSHRQARAPGATTPPPSRVQAPASPPLARAARLRRGRARWPHAAAPQATSQRRIAWCSEPHVMYRAAQDHALLRSCLLGWGCHAWVTFL